MIVRAFVEAVASQRRHCRARRGAIDLGSNPSQLTRLLSSRLGTVSAEDERLLYLESQDSSTSAGS